MYLQILPINKVWDGNFDWCAIIILILISTYTPRFEDRSLESSAIGEGDLPGSEFLWDDVHRVQVLGSLEFSLTTREERDTWT